VTRPNGLVFNYLNLISFLIFNLLPKMRIKSLIVFKTSSLFDPYLALKHLWSVPLKFAGHGLVGVNLII